VGVEFFHSDRRTYRHHETNGPFGQYLEKYSNITFHENQSCGNRIVPCGRTDGWTDMTKLIVAFRNFANAPKETDANYPQLLRVIK
jgi:hypothetical protein